MPSINIALGSELDSLNYSIYNINANTSVSSGSLQSGSGTQPLDLTPGSTPGTNYRIYFYSGSLPLSSEPDGMRTTTTPFSFIEYNINAAGQISFDTSYINDWAYPIQINDGTNTYGFHNANGVVANMASQAYASFFPASASATNQGAVGQTADLYDPVNKRFIGPLSIFTNQATWAGWTHALQWTEADWASTAAANWMQFGSDVPFGAMPYGGAGTSPPGTGFVPSSTASQTKASFGQLPAAPGNWPAWINGAGSPYSSYPTPQYGFDFSTAYPFSPANNNDNSGEDQSLPTNFAVWNWGYSQYESDIPPGNVSPDNYQVGSQFYSNGYTAALRAQALTDGGQHTVNSNPKSGFFTFPLDNFNGEFNNYDPSTITLTIWPLATASAVGTAQNDIIKGTNGNDAFLGGGGGDAMTGAGASAANQLSNGGKDRYLYFSANESQPRAGFRDQITDFQTEDKLDFSGFDADRNKAGIQSFRWIGNNAFSGKAGELRYSRNNHDVMVQASIDTDKNAEFELLLLGNTSLSRSQLELLPP